MKTITKKTLLLLLLVALSTMQVYSQLSVSSWNIHEGTEGVIKHKNSKAGDPQAYPLAKIPAVKDAGWKMAPKDANGNVSMNRSSVLKCREELDFTYFQSIVNIPTNMAVTDFKVSYDNADDGARIYIFNSKFPNGTFDPNSDLIGKNANFASANLKDKLAFGENRIVIVQFDDCAVGNSVKGIRILINGKEATTAMPDKFKVHAFSVNEGKTDKDDYYFSLNANNSRGVILSSKALVNGAKLMEVQRVDVDNNYIAFKVLNAGADMYLVARANKEVHVEKAVGGKIPDGAKFKTIVALTAAKGANEQNYRSFESVKFPNNFLRHESFILFVHPNNNTELFKQDASWLIQKM